MKTFQSGTLFFAAFFTLKEISNRNLLFHPSPFLAMTTSDHILWRSDFSSNNVLKTEGFCCFPKGLPRNRDAGKGLEKRNGIKWKLIELNYWTLSYHHQHRRLHLPSLPEKGQINTWEFSPDSEIGSIGFPSNWLTPPWLRSVRWRTDAECWLNQSWISETRTMSSEEEEEEIFLRMRWISLWR